MDSDNPLRTYLMQKWSGTHELINQKDNNFSKAKANIADMKIKSLNIMADGLVKYISSAINSAGDVNSVNVLAQLAIQLGIKGVKPETLLGYCIQQQFMKINAFTLLQKKVKQIINNQTKAEIFNDSSDSDDIQITFDKKQSIKYSEKLSEPQNFYARNEDSAKQSLNSSTITFEFDESESEVFLKFQQSLNNDQIEQQNEEVQKYLQKLSKSTTELSYLCQKWRWTQPDFQQTRSKINDTLFSCVASVDIRFKNNNFKLQSECAGAISKKQAKRVASLFLLRKIYNKLPQVWQKYKQIRQSNQVLQQPLNANNAEIFSKAKFDLTQMKMFKNEQQQHHDWASEYGKEVDQYLKTLANFKAEMNLLVGRYSKRIIPPEYQRAKQDEVGLWPVKAFVMDGDRKYEAKARQSSKKYADEKCCRQLLFQLFIHDIDRWKNFKQYKDQKGFK